MLGVIYYLLFLIIGFIYSSMFFKEKDIYYKLWSGLVFGNIILMAGIIPFALIFKFTYISHILLIIAAIIPIVVLGIKHKDVVQSIFSEKTVYLKKHLLFLFYEFFVLLDKELAWAIFDISLVVPPFVSEVSRDVT